MVRRFLESLLYLILAIGLIIVLLGFLRMRRWSWVFLMTWVGFSMVVGLEDYFYFGESKLCDHGIRCDHRFCAQPGGCAAHFRDQERYR